MRSADDVGPLLAAVQHVPEVGVEEFIEGDEFTYDAILAGGETLFENVAWYRPKPLVARQNPWISPQAVCLADIVSPTSRPGWPSDAALSERWASRPAWRTWSGSAPRRPAKRSSARSERSRDELLVRRGRVPPLDQGDHRRSDGAS